jgi:hypothetical protein
MTDEGVIPSIQCKMSLRQPTLRLSLSLLLLPTVSRPVCPGIKHPSGAYDHIFITVTQLRVCCCWALSLTRGRVCRLQLLLALASAVILGTLDDMLLSQIRDFPFRRLPRLERLRWWYSTPLCTDKTENAASNTSSIAVRLLQRSRVLAPYKRVYRATA